jgi:hypothetical protein
MTALRIQIASVTGCGEGLDRDELSKRVGAELYRLLTQEPLPSPPAPGTTIRVPGGRVHVATNGTSASVARALARQIYTAMLSARPCP